MVPPHHLKRGQWLLLQREQGPGAGSSGSGMAVRSRGLCEHLGPADERTLGNFSAHYGQKGMRVQMGKCLPARYYLDRAGSPLLGSTLGSDQLRTGQLC